MFNSFKQQQKHFALKHITKTFGYKCCICLKHTGTRRSNLQKHLAAIHLNKHVGKKHTSYNLLYRCPLCPWICAKKDLFMLERHIFEEGSVHVLDVPRLQQQVAVPITIHNIRQIVLQLIMNNNVLAQGASI